MRKKRAVKKRSKAVQPISEETFDTSAESFTASTNPNAGDIIWYDDKKDSFVAATLKYLKGWFR